VPDYWLGIPLLRQTQPHTCTPACVRMVLSHYGHAVEEHVLAELLETGPAGTLLTSIHAVQELGFSVRLETGCYDDLLLVGSTGIPLITPVHTGSFPHYPQPGGAHCVVVLGAHETEVRINDPARMTPEVIPADAFDDAWAKRHRRMVILTPTVIARGIQPRIQ
jgi:ABC-type bacteriocin/lantibiotic exporter with double-glycine peptidase domain